MHPTRLASVLGIVAFTIATAATAGAQPAQPQPSRPRNLKVLSPDLSRDSVVTIMRFGGWFQAGAGAPSMLRSKGGSDHVSGGRFKGEGGG